MKQIFDVSLACYSIGEGVITDTRPFYIIQKHLTNGTCYNVKLYSCNRQEYP